MPPTNGPPPTGLPYDAEYRMFAHDGRIVRFHDEAVLVRDEAGAPLYWQGIMYDVTAQREGEIRALEAEARYRTLVEQLPAIVYSEDITGDGSAGRLHQPTRAGTPGHRAGGVGGGSERVDGGDPSRTTGRTSMR